MAGGGRGRLMTLFRRDLCRDLWRPLIGVIVAYAVAAQALLIALGGFSLPASAGDAAPGFELCLHDTEGAPAAPAGIPDQSGCNHCIFCFAGAHHALAPAPSHLFFHYVYAISAGVQWAADRPRPPPSFRILDRKSPRSSARRVNGCGRDAATALFATPDRRILMFRLARHSRPFALMLPICHVDAVLQRLRTLLCRRTIFPCHADHRRPLRGRRTVAADGRLVTYRRYSARRAMGHLGRAFQAHHRGSRHLDRRGLEPNPATGHAHRGRLRRPRNHASISAAQGPRA